MGCPPLHHPDCPGSTAIAAEGHGESIFVTTFRQTVRLLRDPLVLLLIRISRYQRNIKGINRAAMEGRDSRWSYSCRVYTRLRAAWTRVTRGPTPRASAPARPWHPSNACAISARLLATRYGALPMFSEAGQMRSLPVVLFPWRASSMKRVGQKAPIRKCNRIAVVH